MALNTLLLSQDPALLALMRRSLDELNARIETCSGAAAASELIARRKFQFIVVDCDGVESAPSVLRGLRNNPSNKYSIVLAVVHEHTSQREAFEWGANFVLEKPIANDRLLRCMRAAYPLLMRELRRCHRHAMDISVMLQLGVGAETRARVLDLSEGGMLVQTPTQVPQGNTVRFRFLLPETDVWLEGKAHITWSNDQGRTGLQFVTMGQALRVELANWLGARISLDSPKPPALTPGPQPVRPAAHNPGRGDRPLAFASV